MAPRSVIRADDNTDAVEAEDDGVPALAADESDDHDDCNREILNETKDGNQYAGGNNRPSDNSDGEPFRSTRQHDACDNRAGANCRSQCC